MDEFNVEGNNISQLPVISRLIYCEGNPLVLAALIDLCFCIAAA